MKREFLQNLKVNDQPLSKEVTDAILAENAYGEAYAMPANLFEAIES